MVLEGGDTRTPSFSSSGIGEAKRCSEGKRGPAESRWHHPETIKDERVLAEECIACSC